MQGYVSCCLNSMRGEFIQARVCVTHPHVSDLSVWLSSTNSVSCTQSDPRKRSETLVSMNRLTPPPPPPTYLWWCISGISCSLSEWADWIGVFPLHDPFHTGGTNGAKKSFHFLVAHISLNVFTDCNFLLRCAAEIYQPIILGWGQGPPLSALHYQKGLCGLINIDRRLPWRWTKCDVRSVISDTGQFLSVVMNDSVPPPTW